MSIKHRFDILFTRKQVKKNLNERTVYESKMPLAIFAILNVAFSLTLFGFIAFLVRNILGVPMMTMNYALIEIICIYLAIRHIRKQFAKRNVITRNQLNTIERNILRDIRILSNQANDGYNVTINRETRRKLRKYNMIYPALITPSNKEIIMHRRHINAIVKSLKFVNMRINSRYTSIPHIHRFKKRKVVLERKLAYHQNAIDQDNINKSIDNFYTIQGKMEQFDPSYKHRAKTLRFKLHKMKTVRCIRQSFSGYIA